MTAAMVHLGDKLGLYRALAGAAGPLTPAELATATGLDERWVREWAYNQGAARLVQVDDDGERFSLTPESAAVLADDTADPVHVAADLISQAEHDPLAGAVLVTTSEELADAVLELVPGQVSATKHGDRITTALDGTQSGIVLVDDLAAGLAVVDAYAAEHLEIQTRDARAVAMRVRNAGAIFIGGHTPEAIGDYVGGSNHVLPTARSARFSSGLGVNDFVKRTSLLKCSPDALRALGPAAIALGEAEGLQAHARSVSIRLNLG